MIEYIMDRDNLKIEVLISFVRALNEDFIPELSSRVDIGRWIRKIIQSGRVIVAEQDGKIVGLIAFYANNRETSKGYISYVAVSSEYRKQGIVTGLLQRCFTQSKLAGMKTIDIHTNNPDANRFYVKIGFKLQEQEEQPEYGLIRYHLERQL